MLLNLRQGSPLYILHATKSELSVEQATVDTTNATFMNMGYYTPYPLELTVRIGTRTATYKGLPGNAEIAPVREQNTGEEIILASSQEAIDKEINRLKQESLNALNKTEYHRQRVASCDTIRMQLHPEEVAKVQQQAEIESMRNQMAELQEQMKQQTEINQRLLNQLQGGLAHSPSKHE